MSDVENEAELAGSLYGLEAAADRSPGRQEARRWAASSGRRLVDERYERWAEEMRSPPEEAPVEELLHRRVDNRLIPGADIEEARLGKGMIYARLSLRLRDRSRVTRVWLPGDGRWEGVTINSPLAAAYCALRGTLGDRLQLDYTDGRLPI